MEGINVSIYTLNDPLTSFYIKKLRPKIKQIVHGHIKIQGQNGG